MISIGRPCCFLFFLGFYLGETNAYVFRENFAMYFRLEKIKTAGGAVNFPFATCCLLVLFLCLRSRRSLCYLAVVMLTFVNSVYTVFPSTVRIPRTLYQ